ncbi:MAG: DNA-directed RNA polymerase subunit beta' [Candidatus Schekmanbacteria bacterium]|nr:DNA-directed RNA polymerase subunit beta' [Candidatus Schekmanbacteria bacterium]
MEKILSLFEGPKDAKHFNAIRIRLASAETIRSWSYGEVVKPETINYRTFKPERGGLFCAKIFGPTKDWECNCGKYKRMKHRGVVCDKCGVEVIQSKVRRERLGHIELAFPVSHVWFFKGLPSRIGQVVDLPMNMLERVLYYEMYVVIHPGPSGLKRGEIISEERYHKLKDEFGEKFYAGMGSEGVRELLKECDPDRMADELRAEMQTEPSILKRKRIVKRLKVVESFRKSGNRPEWMILDAIPVIPPELRPLVPLDGGRFATSDLNDLYRRVINRNNRLKRLMDLKAPEVIIRNEKRMLQEAVDALFDNGRRGRSLKGPNNRPLRSLSDMLKGKQGRFRQNLLGKRVDYSGRSVIVVGPELKLHQCGLPKKMAKELFKPFIFNKLEEKGFVTTIKGAKKMVEEERPEIWDMLEEVISDHPVLLNRAPTLHRLGIQAFQPILVEGKAIRIHPLVCTAFNADFDGDQMAVHVPLSLEAQLEAKLLMLASRNILSPASGRPLAVPSKDIVLGCYFLTRLVEGLPGEGRAYRDCNEVLTAYHLGYVALHAMVKVRIDGELAETTVGRVIFNQILPPEFPFVNKLMRSRELTKLVGEVYVHSGRRTAVEVLDKMKDLGFEMATQSGVSICIDDMVVPGRKPSIIEEARQEVIEVGKQYHDGIITNGERYNKVIDIWSSAAESVAEEMFKGFHPSNSIHMMADSGARGSKQQIRQLAGMRGLMAKPSGEIIETPITSNFREGLTVLQYFISTHGARKGLADTALKTANSGYLTRRLVDVSQDVIVSDYDCGTLDGITVEPIIEGGEIVEALRDRILGRVALEDIYDPYDESVSLCDGGQEITETRAQLIEDAGLDRVLIRSVLTCQSRRGVCVLCYGRNLATGRLVDIGEAVGVIAAQSIGEPGTQLTMHTFHIGGTASRVAEQSTHQAKHAGTVKYLRLITVTNKDGRQVAMNRNGAIAILDAEGRERERYGVVYGTTLRVNDGDRVDPEQVLAEWDPFTFVILTEHSGICKLVDVIEEVTMKEELDETTGRTTRVILEAGRENRQPRAIVRSTKRAAKAAEHLLPSGSHLVVFDGQEVHAGDVLAKIPRETTKTKDITGGLPRVIELFEARKPKDHAVISEIEGTVRVGGIEKGMRRVAVEGDEGTRKDYSLPRGMHVNVLDGDRVRAGEPLTDGPVNPHDILHVLGEKELQKSLVNEIQEVYRLQGVDINDKHIEVIVRQMLRQVRITKVGDTEFLDGEQVDRWQFLEENERVQTDSGVPAQAVPVLQGVTKASLSTDSFISSASFQETTRVLTEAAVTGAIDELRGLKENVIVGRLIPAGTGMTLYRKSRTAKDIIPRRDDLVLDLGEEEASDEDAFGAVMGDGGLG